MFPLSSAPFGKCLKCLKERENQKGSTLTRIKKIFFLGCISFCNPFVKITLERGDRVRAGAAVEALPSRLSRLPFSLSLRICVHSHQNLCPSPSQSMSLSLRVIVSEVVSTTARHNCRDALFLQSKLLSKITIVQKTKFVWSHLLFPILSKGDSPTFQLSRQIVGFNIVLTCLKCFLPCGSNWMRGGRLSWLSACKIHWLL